MTEAMHTRRETLRLLATGAAALALPGCATLPAAAPDSPATAGQLEKMAWRLLELGPEGATALGLDTGAHAALRGRLGDRSPAGVSALERVLKTDLALADRIDPAPLDAATRTSVDVVRSAYRTALDGMALPYGDVAAGGWRNTPYAVIQNVGAYLDVPRFLDADHPVRNAADAEAYLSRLAQFPALLDGELARIRSAAGQGLIPPDFLLDKTMRQLRQSIADAESGGGLVRSLADRTRNIPGEWERRAREIVTARVAPALRRQLAEIEAQRARAVSAPGMDARPHGDAFYAWALRASTTTRRTPQEVHAQGLDELAALHARMDPILRSLGYTSGSVGARMAALGEDARFRFPADDAGRAEIVATMQAKIDFIRGKLPLAFHRLVPGKLEIRRLPPAEEEGGPRAYGGAGSIDGSIPGKVWVNLGDTSRHNRLGLPSLTFHEGIPGHVWQGEYALRLPLIRTLLAFNAYSEGWALYAEQLADELGAYEGDPAGRLGFLQNLAWRAVRMVVDTGLHARGWTRQQAIDWFIGATGMPLAEVTSEIDRYCSWPGQACGYKMGQSEIVRQRALAQAALGARFDLRHFNQAVVDGGNVPLDVLAGNVGRYVSAASGG